MKFVQPAMLLVAAAVSTSALSISSNNATLSNEVNSLKNQAELLEHKADALEAQIPHKKQTRRKYIPHPNAKRKVHGNITASRPIVGRTNTGGVRMLNGLTVITTPYFSAKPAWDGSDLLVSMPTMNEDLRLLQLKSDLNAHYLELGIPDNIRPIVELSGKVEGDVLQGSSYGSNVSDINLSGAELDFNADVSKWATAFISIDYDDGPFITGNRVGRVSNSRLYLRRGFLTIGDLDVTPVYFTMGQLYVPFGQYNNAMLSSPLTRTIFRTNTRAVVLGYSQSGLFAQAYGFHGVTHTGNSNNKNEWGLNIGYNNPKDEKVAYGFGVGYINDVADSQGMEITGNTTITQFQGFASVNTTTGVPSNALQHTVPGFDVHAHIGAGHFNFYGEYITSTRHFAPIDMSYNYNGAEPAAMHTEADYSTTWWAKPVTLGLAYGRSWQALALLVPKNSFTVVGNISIWKDTIESLEYRYDQNYGSTTRATGGGRPAPIFGTSNRNQNIVTLQFGVYF